MRDAYRRFSAVMKKGKYALLVLALGLLLLLWPRTGTDEDAKASAAPAETAFDVEATQREMEELLSTIAGAGRVRVMLSVASSPKQVLATDQKTGASDSSVTTVTVSSRSEGEQPVVLYTTRPEYRGAVIVAEGADDSTVRLAVTRAVAGLTGLGSDKIVVVKMKEES